MASSSSRDYYADLGVPPSATAEQIKSAYHKLVLKHHPDKQPPFSRPDSTDFRRIQEAWECLGDKKKRAAFDKTYQRVRKSSAGVRKDQSADVPLGGRSYVSPAAMAEWKETLRKLAEEETRPAREKAVREEQERREQAARDEAARMRAEQQRICREKRGPAKEAKIQEQKWRDKMSEYPIHEWSAELYSYMVLRVAQGNRARTRGRSKQSLGAYLPRQAPASLPSSLSGRMLLPVNRAIGPLPCTIGSMG